MTMIDDSDYDKVLQQYTWTILVLLYFAASDGAVKAHERVIIAEFFKRRNPHLQFDALKIEEILKLFGRPDKTSFHKLVRERDGDSPLLQDIYETALAIVASNSKAHTEQERAIDYLLKSWKGRIVA
jgi:hypothetical protein